jgi:hypothetical protein
MAVRKPPATREEVLRAVDYLCDGRGGIKLNSATSVAGLVAQYRGCPDTWPDKDRISFYVSLSSVKSTLNELVAEGKVYAVSSGHWAANHRGTGRFTYYINEAKRQQLIKDQIARDNVRREAKRAEWVSGKLHKRFAMIVDELREEWERDNPQEDWEARW